MAENQNLLMPKLGLTMTEGTVTEWKVQPGAAFKAGGEALAVGDPVAAESAFAEALRLRPSDAAARSAHEQAAQIGRASCRERVYVLV